MYFKIWFAVGNQDKGYMLTEKDWSVLDSCTPYEKSKLLAEQSAWEFVKNLSGMIRQYGDKQYFILFYSALPLGQGHHNSVSQFLWARIT